MQRKKTNFSLHMIREFLELESAGGIVLLAMLFIALVVANSPLAPAYQNFMHTSIRISIDHWILDKSLLHWINDGLMTIFFMLLALEIKREKMAGQLSKMSQIILPCVAAFGGIVMPVVVFYMFNRHDAHALVGWAIPTATDVALALGIVALLGKRVPISLKIFLVVLAIVDDIIAITLIAIFYTQELSYLSLSIAGVGILTLLLLNYLKITRISVYMVVGVIIWLAVLKSGVHATLAGVAIGFCIPFKGATDSEFSPLQELEHRLHPWVAYLVLPLFVLANAGVQFNQLSLSQLTQPVPMGIIFGLFVGKQLGIFIFSWFVIKMGWAKLPQGANWMQFYGIAILAGIGFTMSLFISGLAYGSMPYALPSSAGIILGSCLSAIMGVAMILLANNNK